jgi:hypothetical protein
VAAIGPRCLPRCSAPVSPAIVAAAVLDVALRSPALPVAAVGLGAFGIRVASGRERPGRALEVVGAPLLIGLFGVAVGLGTLGRFWSGPATLLAHLDLWGTALVGAVGAVLVNNLPAAPLAARRPDHPFVLLVGLNLGPNLFVTGRSPGCCGCGPPAVRESGRRSPRRASWG